MSFDRPIQLRWPCIKSSIISLATKVFWITCPLGIESLHENDNGVISFSHVSPFPLWITIDRWPHRYLHGPVSSRHQERKAANSVILQLFDSYRELYALFCENFWLPTSRCYIIRYQTALAYESLWSKYGVLLGSDGWAMLVVTRSFHTWYLSTLWDPKSVYRTCRMVIVPTACVNSDTHPRASRKKKDAPWNMMANIFNKHYGCIAVWILFILLENKQISI